MNLPFNQTKFFNPKYGLWLLLVWQAVSVYLMSVGVWSPNLVWITITACALYILVVSPYDTALLLIASIPFYVAVPNHFSDSLSSWRILFAWAFVVWLAKYAIESIHMPAGDAARQAARSITKLLFPWDRYAAAVLAAMAASAIVARFPVQSVKQLAFLVNVYFLYIIIAASVRTKSQAIELVKYAAGSAALIVLVGYGQLALTFVMETTFFWQYWATHVAQEYYGAALGHVLTYSNSWFSYTGGIPELRMFSIMPDSHSFAVVASFLIGFLLALIPVYYKKKKGGEAEGLGRFLPSKASYVLWNSIRASGLAVILSGTRGVWVGILPPLVVSAWLWWKRRARAIMKRISLSYLLIILFFILTPFINQGLAYIRVNSFKENFLLRAASIYNLDEESNIGRLAIWKSSFSYAVHHPFGVGIGNFVVSLVQDIPPHATFNSVAQQGNLRFNLPQKFVTAHNLYLHVLVELGIIGLATFLLFWLKYFYDVIKFARQAKGRDTFGASLVISMAFIILWLLAYSIFDVTLFNDKILMYLFISVALSGLVIKGYIADDQ
jgi:hypothetical protein